MRRKLMLAGAVILLAVVSRVVTAQIDPGYKVYLMEDGVRVGEVFVPERAANAITYDEHWVLYSKYKYPGPDNLRGLIIKAEPSEKPYADVNDFFRRVPWDKKSKYIHVRATESLVKGPIAR